MAIGVFFILLAVLLIAAMPVGGVFGIMSILPSLSLIHIYMVLMYLEENGNRGLSAFWRRRDVCVTANCAGK